ncbi:hypothetical protein [Bradyrhizobium sp. cf659]|uniref:hypothetical protein n=1 Tax=Bradyrhizobium sp. cf659 TaxID=1761771 RepID=UPI000AEB9239|nr:hypothetical protein [Bradyrhizobium sp. cf659]
MLTQVERISKEIILAAGLRPELTFTSFGRHGGTTEASTSGLTETQLMKKVLKGIEPSYSAWKAPEYCNVFKSHSGISQLFGLLRSLRNFSLSEWRLPPPRLRLPLHGSQPIVNASE